MDTPQNAEIIDQKDTGDEEVTSQLKKIDPVEGVRGLCE